MATSGTTRGPAYADGAGNGVATAGTTRGPAYADGAGYRHFDSSFQKVRNPFFRYVGWCG